MALAHRTRVPQPVQQQLLQRADHIVVHDISNQTGFFPNVQNLTISRELVSVRGRLMIAYQPLSMSVSFGETLAHGIDTITRLVLFCT